MTKQTNTGTALAISTGQPATFDAAGYAALSYTTVGEVLSAGEFGASIDEVQSQPLGTGTTEFFHGFINHGSASLALDRDSTDAGQLLLKDHADGSQKGVALSMKLTLPDGEVIYLDTRIFSFTINVGGANSMIGSTVNARVNRKPVLVAA